MPLARGFLRRLLRGVSGQDAIERLSPLAPAVDAPEKEPEEKCAAPVDTRGIAEFIGAAGISGGINCDVGAEEQVGPGQWHERAVQHAAGEASGSGAAVEALGGSMDDPDDAAGHGGENQQAHGQLPERARADRCFGLCLTRHLLRAKACF